MLSLRPQRDGPDPSIKRTSLSWLNPSKMVAQERIGADHLGRCQSMSPLRVVEMLSVRPTAGMMHEKSFRNFFRRQSIVMRTLIEGLASQMLLDVAIERATYISVDTEMPRLETRQTVLVFSASRLSIENPYILHSSRVSTLVDLVGCSVVEAFTTSEDLVVVFEGNDRLAISLRDKDFASPEAAVYAPDRGPIVVFN